ncbi:MAG: MFS transporter, partial [Phycisphaerales bacterium JB059]
FTVVSRDARYKAKGVIDTFVYRGGDSLGTLADRGAELAAISAGVLAIPLAGVAMALSVFLGFRERARNAAPFDPGVSSATSS